MTRSHSSAVPDMLIPRPGFAGWLDRFLGPGMTNTELGLILAVTLLAVIGQIAYGLTHELNWSALQWIVALLLTFDLAGGVTTNATPAARRWYHRPGQGAVQHLTFVGIHLVQVLLVAGLLRGPGIDWTFTVIVYGYLLIASGLILATPPDLQKVVALSLYAGGLVISLYLLTPTPGLEWFIPVFYLKLLISHLLKD